MRECDTVGVRGMWVWRKKGRRRILELWQCVGLEEKKEKNPRAVAACGPGGKKREEES